MLKWKGLTFRDISWRKPSDLHSENGLDETVRGIIRCSKTLFVTNTNKQHSSMLQLQTCKSPLSTVARKARLSVLGPFPPATHVVDEQ